MAIEFITEDGTSKTTSTSYATVAQFVQYWENRGTFFSDSENIIKGWLNQATDWLDSNYNFKGYVTSTTQALKWPRSDMVNCSGINVDNDEIPTELLNSVCYLAAQVKDADLNQVDSGVKSERYGPVSTTYSNSSDSVSYPAVDKLLKCFIITGPGLVRVN